jgi:hypothetical protein
MLPISTYPAEPETERPFWGYVDLLVFAGLTVAALFLFGVGLAALAQIVPSIARDVQLIALPAQLFLYAVLFLFLWAIFTVKYDHSLWRALGFAPSHIRLWHSFAVGCLLSVGVALAGAALRTPQVESPFDKFLHQPLWIVLFGLFAVIFGPLFEEIVFRGFIQPLLTRDIGNAAGILLTAAVFGLLHGREYSWAWQYIVLVGAAGACFGYARVLGRSLVPAVVMHSGFNAIFFCAAILKIQTHT